MKLKGFVALKDKTEEKLSDICLAVVGEWQGHSSGAFSIDIADIEKMKLNFDKRETDVVIDYEHQTLSGNEAPAAGWIKELYIKDDALWGKVAWNEKAKNYIKNGEYKYISPVFEFFSRDEKTGSYKGATLHSASLTNTPFLDELGEVVANKTNQRKEEIVDREKLAELEGLNTNLKSENDALKDELAKSIVESAIVANKITPEQKEWALTYCKQDKKGFEEFLKSTKPAPKVEPGNNLFANKSEAKSSTFDPVKSALDYKNR